MIITHTKISLVPDGEDTSVVRPSDWNAEHSIDESIPTGTGFVHITSGSQDGTAKLVANEDVDASAGIIESKLALNYPTHAEPTVQTLPTSAGIEFLYAVTSAGGGKCNVPANSACFLNDALTSITRGTIVENTSLALTDLVTNYICADRDTLTWIVFTDHALVDYIRYLPYCEVFRSGTNLHIQTSPNYAYTQINKCFSREHQTQRYARESGLNTIAVDSSLNITSDSAVIWATFTGVKQTITVDYSYPDTKIASSVIDYIRCSFDFNAVFGHIWNFGSLLTFHSCFAFGNLHASTYHVNVQAGGHALYEHGTNIDSFGIGMRVAIGGSGNINWGDGLGIEFAANNTYNHFKNCTTGILATFGGLCNGQFAIDGNNGIELCTTFKNPVTTDPAYISATV